jgi:hypothetical protein
MLLAVTNIETEIARDRWFLPSAVGCGVQLLRIPRLCTTLQTFYTIFCTSKLRQQDNNNLADFQHHADHTALSAPGVSMRFVRRTQQAVVVC